MEATVAQADDYKTMANTIYNYAAVGQSFKVVGVLVEKETRTIKDKGEAVVEYIKYLDELDNCHKNGKRKKVKPSDSVGGFIAQKIFKWKRVISNDEIKYTIWRFQ